MYGYVLQDWITVRGSTIDRFIQNESDWMGFSSFQDVVFWVDIRKVTSSGTLTMDLQTCPTKDDVLFKTLSGCTFAAAVATPMLLSGALPKAILAANPAVPLATWVRWTLINSAASEWDCSFRILVSANKVATS